MKWFLVATIVAVALVAVGKVFTAEGAAALVFGWWSFLARVAGQLAFDWPAVAVGGVALLMLILGLHWLALSLRPHGSMEEGNRRRAWHLRWTLTLVSLVIVLFAAGTAVVGVVHQVGWLATSPNPPVGEQVAGATQPTSDLRFLTLAIHGTKGAKGAFPVAATFADDGTPLHSWETQILPFAGYMTADIDDAKPWNDPANQRFFKCIIPLFINGELRAPPLADDEGYGLNHFAANSRIITSPPTKEIRDETSETILFGEVNANFSPWGRPMNVRDPAAGINRGPQTFGGPKNAHGATFGMADGSARFINEDVDPNVLEALSSPAR